MTTEPATTATAATSTSPDLMRALTLDIVRDPWDQTEGMTLDHVPCPVLDEHHHPLDASAVLIRVLFAGFCGSDRGIWWRKSFKDMIHHSLAAENKTTRIIGHELCGEIVEVGSYAAAKYGFHRGQIVSTESHIVCGQCYQCEVGDLHVCDNDRIIGISTDGCFADYIKLPAQVLWPTNTAKIRPEVAALQEPFGNAVHACQAVDIRGKTVAIFGTGTIGLFAVLCAKALGAARVIGVDPLLKHREMAKALGCDEVIALDTKKPPTDPTRPYLHDPEIVAAVREFGGGHGVDVALEMAGNNTSVNNTIKSVRRGGEVVLFGLRNDDFTVEDFHRVIMNGIKLHGVVGRRIFQTWTITRNLLESAKTGIHDAIFDIILQGGKDTIVPLAEFDPPSFAQKLMTYPKLVIKVGDPS